jgi:hypothetical protein
MNNTSPIYEVFKKYEKELTESITLAAKTSASNMGKEFSKVYHILNKQ